MLENFGVTIAWHGSTVEGFDAIAEEADMLGFGYLWVPEAWGLEAFSLVSHVLSKTSQIRVGTGIVNIFSRSAALIGMGCATLQQIAPQRFMLGLGSSGRSLIENWHGLEYSTPLKRTKEYVDVIRKVVSGEEVEFRGQTMQPLSRFRLFTKPIQPSLEIYLGAVGDTNLRLAGKICQGAILAMYPSSRLKHTTELLGMDDPNSPRKLFTYLPTAVSTSEEVLQSAKNHAAKNIAFYVASMGKYYATNLVRSGYEIEVKNILAAPNQDRIMSVTEKLLSDLSLIGTPEQLFEKISKFPRGVVPVLGFSCASREEVQTSISSMRMLSSYLATRSH